MGIIGKSDREERPAAATTPGGTTLVAAQSHLNGSLTLSDNLHIDGRVEGSIDSKANVAIGESGRFEGEIKAKEVIVCGHLDATVDCQRLEIVASGHVTGEVVTDDLVIESGGRFIGQSRIRDEKNDKTVSLVKSSDSKSKSAGSDSGSAAG